MEHLIGKNHEAEEGNSL